MAMVIALMAVGVIIIAAIMLVFGYPQVYANLLNLVLRPFKKMFRGSNSKVTVAKPHKATPSEALAGKIEQLAPGKTLRYKIAEPEVWGCNFISVDLNPRYPQKGKKYILSREKMANGLPDGNKCGLYDSDDAIQVANSIIERKGIPFATAEELIASTEPVMSKEKKEAVIMTKSK